MRVDLVITELDVGGAERALTRLAIGLQERGDDVRVFSLGSLPREERPGDGKDQLLRSLLEHDVDVVSGEGASGEGANAAQLPSVFRKLKRWLAERPGAVRQSFLFHANVLTGYAIGARKKGAGKKGAGDGAWVGGVRVADPNRLRIFAEGMALRKADHVVCVSRAVRAFSQNRYRLPATRLSVIANGVETQRFQDAVPFDWSELHWPRESRVALFVGRLHEQKNLALLQRTVDRFVDRPERKLVIAGGGPQQAELLNWAERVGHDRVRVLPWQPDVAPLIAACRVFVLPSHYEGMPNVVLEAMAAGKPVVCSRVEGSDELIGDDAEQGFEPNNDVEFIQKVDRFLEDAEFADRVGLANRDRMETGFSVQRMVDAYRDLYRRLLES